MEEALSIKADKDYVAREAEAQQALMEQLVQNAKAGSLNIQELMTKQVGVENFEREKEEDENIKRSMN